MSSPTEEVDHKAEARGLLQWAVGDEPGVALNDAGPAITAALQLAQVHASLAIAEGQERVAKQMERIANRLDSVTEVSAHTQFGSGKRYLKVKP